MYTKKDILIEASNVLDKLSKYNKREYSYNRVCMLKVSCGYYCSLMKYSEPDN